MLIHECKLEFQFKKSSKNVKFGQCLYLVAHLCSEPMRRTDCNPSLNNIIHQIYCFNTLTNVLKRATLIRDVNKTYDRDSLRYKSTNLHWEIL